MTQEEMIFEKEDNVAIATLNLPAKLNALSPNIMAGFWRVIDEVHADDSIRALVITGVGRGFCSGADVEALAAAAGGQGSSSEQVSPSEQVPPDEAPPEVRTTVDIAAELRKLPKPVIGAINGVAAGGGFSLAMGCDIRIASEKARFVAAWIRRAVMPDLGITYMLPREVGLSKACEVIFSGDNIDAAEAERIGLVNRVVPHEQLLSTTMELAKKLAKAPPMVIRYAKEAIYGAQHMTLEAAVELEAERFATCLASEDAAEGVRSFLEKREPNFKGR